MKQIYIIMGMIFSLLFFVERTYAEPFSQDRSMEVACLKHIELTKKEMSPKQCSCQNDYYAKLLKPQEILLEFGYQTYPTALEDSGYNKLNIINTYFDNKTVK